ncbi:hypothetical protein [Nitrospira moscoviensis]|uniref:N-acetyltransferase domain-containing protein n=1 Tax=Nitrospira moscoviensis TaxID=42253 RepID=A0A0K2GFN9_NITMO|nr:hypothetical protein [Nitrospira moscoviensis]ALA59780.1 hypothetical protein NITMOv2_3388 [Nitrospira moscoviensis]
MAITVRPADLESDRSVLIETLRRYLTPTSTERRFDWLYKRNPHGEARAWIAEETATRAVVGVAAAFPRRLLVRGDARLTWVLGDFCISADYRTLGPAVQLQRAVLDAVQHATMLAGYYDFPSRQMAAVYKRIGVAKEGGLVRMARVLRADRLLTAFGGAGLARVLGPVANLGLALDIHRRGASRGLSVERYAGRFGSEFDDLMHETGGAYDACIERSADYLNWRYVEHPSERYEYLVAKKSGRVCGYAVFSSTAQDAILVDLFSVKLESIPDALLRHLAKELWGRGVLTISAPMVAGHPWMSALTRAGFRARETSPFVVVPGPSRPADLFQDPQAPWHFMHGDRDS